jgi:ferric-dicitrate binding protein FerR (iron transport regulator)
MDKNIAYYIIKGLVDKTISKESRIKVKRWLIANDDNEAKVSALEQLWHNTLGQSTSYEVDCALQLFRQNRDSYDIRRKRKTLFFKIIRYSVAALFLFIFGVAIWRQSAVYITQQSEMTECVAQQGTIRTIHLSDGTVVKLNAGSSLHYPKQFNTLGKTREVYLEGEAFFDVAKDKSFPFVVHVENLKVQVLGTVFNIKAYPGEEHIVTTLLSGRVRLSSTDSSLVLHPNEQVLYSRANGVMKKALVDGETYESWVDGDLNFDDQPLSEIVHGIERKYNVVFVLAPGVDPARRFNLRFKKDETIDEICTVVSRVAMDIDYRRHGNKIILYMK